MRIVVMLLFLMSISACSRISYIGRPDGSTEVHGWEIGSKTALSGACFLIDKNGRRVLLIESLRKNSAEGAGKIAEGVAAGAVRAIKPL